MIVSIGAGKNALRYPQRQRVERLLDKMRWALDHAPRKEAHKYQAAIFWLELYS